jgi:hypothetical protein
MANNVNITSKGIQKVLQNYTSKLALAEYIWNGFDAKADTIKLNYAFNVLGAIEYIEVIDNGYGINFEKLATKFNPFYESEKAIEITAPKHTSTMHGKNGVGRLTFFKFAKTAKWITTYEKDIELESCSIQIGIDGLNTYKADILDKNTDSHTGTKVTFTNVHIPKEELEKSIIPYLISEFCWFLELNKNKEYSIIINGIPLDYGLNIADYEENVEIKYEASKILFKFNGRIRFTKNFQNSIF